MFRLRVAIAFKLHSLDPSVYDSLAGRRNAVKWADYRIDSNANITTKIPQGLKNLLEAGYSKTPLLPVSKPLLDVETVVVRQNLYHIPAVARFCKELGIDCMVETLIRTGRVDLEASILARADDLEARSERLLAILERTDATLPRAVET